jgi:hypothetical protein
MEVFKDFRAGKNLATKKSAMPRGGLGAVPSVAGSGGWGSCLESAQFSQLCTVESLPTATCWGAIALARGGVRVVDVGAVEAVGVVDIGAVKATGVVDTGAVYAAEVVNIGAVEAAGVMDI